MPEFDIARTYISLHYDTLSKSKVCTNTAPAHDRYSAASVCSSGMCRRRSGSNPRGIGGLHWVVVSQWVCGQRLPCCHAGRGEGRAGGVAAQRAMGGHAAAAPAAHQKHAYACAARHGGTRIRPVSDQPSYTGAGMRMQMACSTTLVPAL